MFNATNEGKGVAGLPVDGAKIRRLRNRAIMSRQELVHKARVSYSTVANLETGFKERATPETIRKIAYGLGVEPAVLVIPEGEGVGAAYAAS